MGNLISGVPMQLTVLDLFSGIGGFSLGLERTGWFKTVAFCEIDPFAQKILRKNWPDIPIYDDVRKVNYETLKNDGIIQRRWGGVDVITGGFPCQDLSLAGKQAGIEGERSGLWGELARITNDLRPQYLIVENVTALLSGGDGMWFAKVLGDLAEIGFDAEWHCIPASSVGAPHIRDRVWLLAYPGRKFGTQPIFTRDGGKIKERHKRKEIRGKNWIIDQVGTTAFDGVYSREIELAEPKLVREDDGVSCIVDRLRGIGNTVVPQIPEMIGSAIIKTLEHGR